VGNVATIRRCSEGERLTNENQVREKTVGFSPHGARVTALAGLVSHVAWGGPGDVDPSFADGGFFTSEELSGSANSILAPGDGTYIVSGGYTRGSFWAPQEIYTRDSSDV
jgi:hypothetical protein